MTCLGINALTGRRHPGGEHPVSVINEVYRQQFVAFSV